MATNKTEDTNVKTKQTTLQKRIAPKENDSNMPLKKREVPTESLLKKRVSPDETQPKKDKPSKIIFSKSTTTQNDSSSDKSTKAKSDLEIMRQRVAAQKQLEQDIMTKQALRNQEKDGLRSRLRDLNKELEEDSIIQESKPIIDFDLKKEALEAQNKKIKQDLEKAKQQLQAIFELEYNNMKVLDPNSLSLSNEFVETINTIKQEIESKKNSEEQSLKNELLSLQKELTAVKNKNLEAKKASEEAQKIASQAEKAAELAKKAIEEQESDEVRDFKKEIVDLKKTIKQKEDELKALSKTSETKQNEFDQKISEIKASLDEKVKTLTKEIKEKEKLLTKCENQRSTLAIDKDKLSKENKTLNNLVKSLENKLDSKDEKWQEKYNEAVKKQKELMKDITLKEKTVFESDLAKEKERLENQLKTQTNKIDELLLEYQKRLQEKDNECESLKNEILISQNKNNEIINKLNNDILNFEQDLKIKDESINSLSISLSNLPSIQDELKEKIDLIESLNNEVATLTKDYNELNTKYNGEVSKNSSLNEAVSNNQEKELKERCDNYQALLVSERNSHLQVEQRLCKDLDDYKAQIESLQTKLTSMSTDQNIIRLNKQIDVIENYIQELKDNPKEKYSSYNTYYEKIIKDLKDEQDLLFFEIKKRNDMLKILRDEKISVVKYLKEKKNNKTEILEKQIVDINKVIDFKIQRNNEISKKQIENEILDNIKQDLVKYCSEVKEYATTGLEKISKKYASITSINELIKEYNNDCNSMNQYFGNEISRLSLDRNMNNNENTNNAIEEKIILIQKQYKDMTEARDQQFNTRILALRSQQFDEYKKQLSNDYFAFVGEEYIKSLNNYQSIKKSIEDEIDRHDNEYNDNVKRIKEEEDKLLIEISSLKTQIDEAIKLENNDSDINILKGALNKATDKVENIRKYILPQLTLDNQDQVQVLQNELSNVTKEEELLMDLYQAREKDAKERIKVSEEKDEFEENEYSKQIQSDYVYIQGESERIIESVQERRERLEKEQNQKEEEENISQVLVDYKSDEIKSHEKDQIFRIRIEDNIGQKDLAKIKELTDEVSNLKFMIANNNETVQELKVKYNELLESEKQLSSFKDTSKYLELIKEYQSINAIYNQKKDELDSIDPKENKKGYKVAHAEYKSLFNKLEYLQKVSKKLSKNKQVSDYKDLLNKIKSVHNEFQLFEKRNDELQIRINQAELEIQELKAN